MTNTKFTHIPVLLEKSAEFLITKKNGIYVDATLGLGGHSKYFLDILDKDAKLISIDRDTQALEIAKENLKNYENITIVHGNFADIENILEKLQIKSVNGIFFDLGLSSYQLDIADRGFSFNKNGPLDMRFDQKNTTLTAEKIINEWSLDKLIQILKDYGEERFAYKIAREIVRTRKIKPIKTTADLAFIIERIIKRRGSTHPATRTFQAIRIAVNLELENIKNSLDKITPLITSQGRIVVISYHSLEDRIIKYFFKQLADEKKWCVLTKKPITADKSEVEKNPRSRSAKMRVIEKTNLTEKIT